MKQRTERLGREIQSILGELLARGEIKDPRVRDAGLVTVTHVRVTGDLREARVAFTAFGAPEPVLERARQGLQSASPYLQRAIGQRLRTRNTPTLHFDIDHVLDEALRVDSLLRQVRAESAPTVAEGAEQIAVDEGEGEAEGDSAEGGEPAKQGK
jgi:ribosome-binding factor A